MLVVLTLRSHGDLVTDRITLSADPQVKDVLNQGFHEFCARQLLWRDNVAHPRCKLPVHVVLNWLEVVGWKHTSMAETVSEYGVTTQTHVLRKSYNQQA